MVILAELKEKKKTVVELEASVVIPLQPEVMVVVPCLPELQDSFFLLLDYLLRVVQVLEAVCPPAEVEVVGEAEDEEKRCHRKKKRVQRFVSFVEAALVLLMVQEMLFFAALLGAAAGPGLGAEEPAVAKERTVIHLEQQQQHCCCSLSVVVRLEAVSVALNVHGVMEFLEAACYRPYPGARTELQ